MRLGWLVIFGFVNVGALTAGCAGQGSAVDGALEPGIGGAGGASSTSGAGGDATTSEPIQACAPNAQQACSCTDDLGVTTESTQTCKQDGSGWGECDCACGDNLCDDTGGENCHTCKSDCGACAPCEYKSCDQAKIPPPAATMLHAGGLDTQLALVSPSSRVENLQARLADPDPGMRVIIAALLPARADESQSVAYLRGLYAEHPADVARIRQGLAEVGLVDLSQYADRFPAPGSMHTMGLTPDGGTEECGAPLFRVRLAQVTTVRVHSTTNDQVYCAVTAESNAGDEVAVTPATSNLGKGDSYQYTIANGIVWGNAGPRAPKGPLRLTYDCFEQDDPDGAKNLLEAIGTAAGSVGSIPGMPYGWAFGVGGAVLSGVGTIIGQNKDDHIFNATQTIAAEDQLELTKGAYWTVSRGGDQTIGRWQWDLRMEIWGCAEYGVLP